MEKFFSDIMTHFNRGLWEKELERFQSDPSVKKVEEIYEKFLELERGSVDPQIIMFSGFLRELHKRIETQKEIMRDIMNLDWSKETVMWEYESMIKCSLENLSRVNNLSEQMKEVMF